MELLIDKITKRTGMDKQLATEAILAICDHVKEQYPLLQTVVDRVLGKNTDLKENANDLKPVYIEKNFFPNHL